MLFNKSYLLKTYKLKNLIRYNHKTKLTCENVSEHSYFVTLFTLKICDYLHVDDKTKLDCLIKALIHDAPEIEINDITYDVKAKNPELLSILHSLERDFYKKYYYHYLALMADESSNLVNNIVKLADAYSVVQFSLNEIELGNKNKEMINIYKDTVKRVKNLEKELFDNAKK